jgi:hypothetical protein
VAGLCPTTSAGRTAWTVRSRPAIMLAAPPCCAASGGSTQNEGDMGATGGYLHPLAIKRILGMLTEAGRSSSRCVISPRMVRRAHYRLMHGCKLGAGQETEDPELVHLRAG